MRIRSGSVLPGVLAVTLCVGMVQAFLPTGQPGRSGQVVFLPSGAVDVAPGASAGAGLLALESCEMQDAGLVVSGRLLPADEQEGVSYVLVTTGDPSQAGVRVGRDDLRDQVQFGSPPAESAFRVVLPWATPESTFIALPANGDVTSPELEGVAVTCP